MQTHDPQQGQPLDDEALDQAAGGASYTLTFTNSSPQLSSVAVFQTYKGQTLAPASVAWLSKPTWTPSTQFNWTVDYSVYSTLLGTTGK